MNGSDFNKLYPNTQFYKFMNDDLIHHDFQYTLGLNIDTQPFVPNSRCSGGLYFCDKSQTSLHWTEYGYKLAYIRIPDDALVCIEHGKYKKSKYKTFKMFRMIFWLRYI